MATTHQPTRSRALRLVQSAIVAGAVVTSGLAGATAAGATGYGGTTGVTERLKGRCAEATLECQQALDGGEPADGGVLDPIVEELCAQHPERCAEASPSEPAPDPQPGPAEPSAEEPSADEPDPGNPELCPPDAAATNDLDDADQVPGPDDPEEDPASSEARSDEPLPDDENGAEDPAEVEAPAEEPCAPTALRCEQPDGSTVVVEDAEECPTDPEVTDEPVYPREDEPQPQVVDTEGWNDPPIVVTPNFTG